jgi:hypothetical protein
MWSQAKLFGMVRKSLKDAILEFDRICGWSGRLGKVSSPLALPKLDIRRSFLKTNSTVHNIIFFLKVAFLNVIQLGSGSAQHQENTKERNKLGNYCTIIMY